MARPIREIPWLSVRKGMYYASWYDQETGRTMRRSMKTDDADLARRRFANFLVHDKALIEKTTDGLTVLKAIEFYETEHVVKTASYSRNISCLAHVKRHMGDMMLRHVDQAACQKYAKARALDNNLRKNQIKEGTIRRELIMLRAAAYHAKKTKRLLIAEMPTFDIPKPRESQVGFYHKSELKKIMAGSMDDIDLWDYMMVLYYTGARRGVIDHLTKGQVDFTSQVIKQAREGAQITNKRKPPIPIDKEILPILERRCEEAKGGRLFPSIMYARYRAHLESMGFAGRAHPHVMRHTRATILLMENVSVYKVANRLGDTVATVEKTYAHAIIEHMRDLGGSI